MIFRLCRCIAQAFGSALSEPHLSRPATVRGSRGCSPTEFGDHQNNWRSNRGSKFTAAWKTTVQLTRISQLQAAYIMAAYSGETADVDHDPAQRNILELLPNEVWTRIIKSISLSRLDLVNLSAVCHVFRDISQPLFHDTLYVDIRYSTDSIGGFVKSGYYERLQERLSEQRITSSVERLVVTRMLHGVRRPPVLPSRFVYTPEDVNIPVTKVFDTLLSRFYEPSRIRHLELIRVKMPTAFLMAIGTLPHLEHLKIEGCAFIDFEEGKVEFRPHPTLKSLHLVYPKTIWFPAVTAKEVHTLFPPLLASSHLEELRLSLEAFSEYQYFLSKPISMPSLRRLAVDAYVLHGRNRPWFVDTIIRYPELQALDFEEETDPLYGMRTQDLPSTLFPKLTQLGTSCLDLPMFVGRPVTRLAVTVTRAFDYMDLHLSLVLNVRTSFPDITHLDLNFHWMTFERRHLFRAFDGLKQLRQVHITCGGLSYARGYRPKEVPDEEGFMFPTGDPAVEAPPLEYFIIDIWPSLARRTSIIHPDDRLPDADLLPHLVRRYPELKYASWTNHDKDSEKQSAQAWTRPEYMLQPESILVGSAFWERTAHFTPRWRNTST
ncbi:hypothetical protein NM688_g6650 [Phlebia brevispora]|uniref:Uncharacterized protein n=1 Tax=Phlebia brevispora TaxID=194682 RepID=A0ACC1SEA7_9APHY|nr:hypothetical protein NM688_g6650 [Phlebia brevispora]